MTGYASRRTLTAYAACLLAIGGLMAIVALGGNAVTPRNAAQTVSATALAE